MVKNENPGSPRTRHNSRIIAKNIAWMSVDGVLALIRTTGTSVAIARVIGKDAVVRARLGSYSYIVWLAIITLTMSSFGRDSAEIHGRIPEQWKACGRTRHLSLQAQEFKATFPWAAAIGFLAVLWLAGPH
jgi:hypothetical protein